MSQTQSNRRPSKKTVDQEETEPLNMAKQKKISSGSRSNSREGNRETSSRSARITSNNLGNKNENCDETENEQCGRCDRMCKEEENCLQCELCEKWYHTECEKIDDATYAILKNDAERPCALIHFYCSKSCNNIASKFLAGFTKMEKEIVQLKDKVTDIQKGNFTEEMIETVKKIAKGQGQENAAENAREIRERESRQKNLIFFNINESNAEQTAERVKHDENAVKLTLEKLEVEVPSFETPIRLGKKGDNPRPLKIRFNDNETCMEIMKSSRKLKGTEIYVSKDMTPLERQEWKALTLERDRKRQESKDKGEEAMWVIRRGKVINIARQPLGESKAQ